MSDRPDSRGGLLGLESAEISRLLGLVVTPRSDTRVGHPGSTHCTRKILSSGYRLLHRKGRRSHRNPGTVRDDPRTRLTNPRETGKQWGWGLKERDLRPESPVRRHVHTCAQTNSQGRQENCVRRTLSTYITHVPHTRENGDPPTHGSTHTVRTVGERDPTSPSTPTGGPSVLPGPHRGQESGGGGTRSGTPGVCPADSTWGRYASSSRTSTCAPSSRRRNRCVCSTHDGPGPRRVWTSGMWEGVGRRRIQRRDRDLPSSSDNRSRVRSRGSHYAETLKVWPATNTDKASGYVQQTRESTRVQTGYVPLPQSGPLLLVEEGQVSKRLSPREETPQPFLVVPSCHCPGTDAQPHPDRTTCVCRPSQNQKTLRSKYTGTQGRDTGGTPPRGT